MRRRAFALVYAITALALLGALISLALIGMRQGLENAAREQQQAQVRQLVLAGTELANSGQTGDVALPGELAGAKLTLQQSGGAMLVEATMGKASLRIDLPAKR